MNAWHATGRFYEANDGTLADYGYFLHLPFPDAVLFDGEPGETTPHFTFTAKPFKAQAAITGSCRSGLIRSANFRSIFSASLPEPSAIPPTPPRENASPRSAGRPSS